jgi:transposase-like protein
MKKSSEIPKTLLEIARHFADLDVCVEFVRLMRWPKGAVCPECGGEKVSYLSTRRIFKCMAKECHKQFSVKVGTIFEDSPVPLDKWLVAVWLVVNCKNGISSYEIARDLKVTQKSAWFMLHRIRTALRDGTLEKMGGPDGGPVEVDEAFIGGAPKNKHISERMAGRYTKDSAGYTIRNPQWKATTGRASKKIPVFGMLDRETRKVRTQVLPEVKRDVLMDAILANVEKRSTIYSDGLVEYHNLKALDFVHDTVNHLYEYVRGEVHTNGIENYWSLFKRGLKGTYIAVEPFHLHRYADEQAFRFNNRATKDNPLDDRDRFMLAVSQISGKRLTYAELTGKVEETSEPF